MPLKNMKLFGKKPQVYLKIELPLIFVFLLLLSIPLASANIFTDFVNWLMNTFGFTQAQAEAIASKINITTTGQGWNLVKSTGVESNLTFWKASNDKKTELGWIPPNNNCAGWTDQKLYNSDGTTVKDDKNKDIVLKCETAKCSGQNCYHISLTTAQAININDYIKLGNASSVAVYQDIKKVSFDAGTPINATLYKNINGNWNNTVNDLFVNFDLNKWKFGAYDNYSTGWEKYKYEIVSSIQPQKINGVWDYGSYGLDLYDICSKVRLNESNDLIGRADCQENLSSIQTGTSEFGLTVYSYTLSITFYSDSIIDPTFSVINKGIGNYVINATTQSNLYSRLNTSNQAPYDSLVGYWAFDSDSGTAAYDWSGNSNTGTYTNGAVINTSCDLGYGNCAGFDGVDDYVDVPINSLSSTITISAWIKSNDNTGNREIFQAESNKIFFRIENGYLKTYLAKSDGYINAVSSGTLSTGFWYHVVFTYNGTTLINYIDGAVNGSDTGTAVPFTSLTSRIGAHVFGNELFNGSIDDVMVFNTALDAGNISEIYNNQSSRFYPNGIIDYPNTLITAGNNTVNVSVQAMEETLSSNIQVRLGEWDISKGYNNTDPSLVGYWHGDGDATDSSGLGNNGVLTNGATATGAGVYNNSFVLDGVNDYVNLSNPSSLNLVNDLTFAVWFKVTGTTGQMIYGGYSLASPYSGIGVGISESGTIGKLSFWSNNTFAWQDSATSINDGTWHHGVIVLNSTNTIFYIDGALDVVRTGKRAGSYTGNKVIGSWSNGGGHYFNGSIDDVMIWNRTLTSDEIKSIYSKGRANWTYGAYQNASTTNSTHSISQTTTNILPEFNLVAGTNSFYTPILFGNVTLNTYGYSTPGDTTNPSINFTSPTTNNGTYEGLTEILANVTATDNIAIDKITIYLYNITDLVNKSIGSSSPYYLNFSSLPFTTYYLNASANDTAGNINWTETRTIVLSADITKPLIEFVSPTDNGGIKSGNLIANTTQSDTNLANTTIYVYNDTGLIYNNTQTGTNTNWSVSLADGLYYFNATAIDTYGNTNSTETRNITLDNTAPICSITEPRENDIYSGTNLTLEASCTDASGIDKTWFNLTSTYQTLYTNQMFTTSYVMQINQTNNYTIIMEGNDTLGNMGIAGTKNFRFVVVNGTGDTYQNNTYQNITYVNQTISGSGLVIICPISKLGYYNPNLPGLRQMRCIIQ